MLVLLDDDRDQLTLRRLWPWHQLLARIRSARLDRALAEGASPEASASLAARAAQLTSTGFRRDLAVGLRRILVAAEPHDPPALRGWRSPRGWRPRRVRDPAARPGYGPGSGATARAASRSAGLGHRQTGRALRHLAS